MLMSNGPEAKIAEIVEVTMPRTRTRADMHHDPQYYRIRNHLVDFLVNRSRLYAGAEAGAQHDPKNPPLVRPGLEGEGAQILPLPSGKNGPQLRQVSSH
jgi:nitrate/nitrite transport system ATP-binding protein